MMELHHVVTRSAWDAACETGHYAPPKLQRDGFLHCCTAEQLAFVVAKHFVGGTDLLVLTFQTEEIPARVR